MKIYDCFMYFDEDLILDVRFNILNEYVDYFVIVESTYNHKGEKRNLKFNIKKYDTFKSKIIYLVLDNLPKDIETINKLESNKAKEYKYINNALKREINQRNFIYQGLKSANAEDIILISDVDEIPFLINIDFSSIKEKIIIFEQIMTHYKFNLCMPGLVWHGTRACRKKNLKSPQWLRNIKAKKYSLLRIDIIFNDMKCNNIKFIKNGGWHFSNLKKPEEIELKLNSYLHHREFELSKVTLKQIKEAIIDKTAIYDLTKDQRNEKIGKGKKLIKIENKDLPNFIITNKEKFNQWFD